MRNKGKRIRWMTELPDRCDHPVEFLEHRDGLLVDYVECIKCGEALERGYARERQRQYEKEQQTL